jgi:hypothetical protein
VTQTDGFLLTEHNDYHSETASEIKHLAATVGESHVTNNFFPQVTLPPTPVPFNMTVSNGNQWPNLGQSSMVSFESLASNDRGILFGNEQPVYKAPQQPTNPTKPRSRRKSHRKASC